jgi:hypothetical protein
VGKKTSGGRQCLVGEAGAFSIGVLASRGKGVHKPLDEGRPNLRLAEEGECGAIIRGYVREHITKVLDDSATLRATSGGELLPSQ